MPLYVRFEPPGSTKADERKPLAFAGVRMKIIHDKQTEVMDWVAARMPLMFGDSIKHAGPYAALGVVDDKGELIAGTIFNDYHPTFSTIQVHLAADTPRWATTNIVRGILAYPFLQLRVNKVWGATPAYLERVLRFNKGIGFTREGVLRHHFGPNQHAVITGMLEKEYRKLYLNDQKEAA